MIGAIACFELKNCFKRLSTYVYFAIFFALGFLTLIVAGGAIATVNTGMGELQANSPYILHALISGLSYYGLLVIAAVMGHSVYQDFLHNTYPLLFTTPISKVHYLAGRYLAANVVLLFIFSSIGLGCLVGSWMPFLDAPRVGGNRVMAYIQPYLISVFPNTLFVGAIFFGLAALRRAMMPVYVSAVVILVGYLIAASLAPDLESRFVSGLLDPFGSFASRNLTRYWTVAEKNTRLVPLAGLLLVNRLVWSGIGAAVLGLTFHRFRFAQEGHDTQRLRETRTTDITPSELSVQTARGIPPGPFLMLPAFAWLEFRHIVTSLAFLLIVLSGVVFIFSSSLFLESMFGTSVYPVTGAVVELARGNFELFMLIIITVYSGQMVWREREAGMDQLCDVLPIPTWLPFASKLLALILVQVLLLGVVMISGIVVQLMQGYYKFELGIYVKDLFGIQFIRVSLLCVLAMVVQVIVNQKYVGQFVMVLYYLAMTFMDAYGFNNHLYQYASHPGYRYSDMNGFGHFIQPMIWFYLYWAAFAAGLAIMGNALWVRGLDVHAMQRLKLAWQRFTWPAQAWAILAFAAFISLGCFIFYNTKILNEYQTPFDLELRAVQYEKQYKRYQGTPQPRIRDVRVHVAIYPDDRKVRAAGSYRLVNNTFEPISTVLVNLPQEVDLKQFSIESTHTSQTDKRLGVYTFQLPQPMKPGHTLTLNFDAEYSKRGIKNTYSEADMRIVYNGTFFDGGDLPRIGYFASKEFSDDSTRRKHGLRRNDGMAPVDKLTARYSNFMTTDADWIDFEAIVSTSLDQIAIAPGSLQREWNEGGRRHFHYKSEAPVLCVFSFLSARYEVLRSQWNDVAIEIYYHKGHEYNLDTMVKAIKMSLDYFTTNFGPYKHKQLRIVEFPRYAKFAQSFPNTITYSEALGFIAKVDPTDATDTNYPFYITAHEVAYQWWGHQVIGANVQGAAMLSETLAQYSALMVMKRAHGSDKMQHFLRYELDNYLSGRAMERKKELPLASVEKDQGYVHHSKGGLVMYALQDYIGEKAVNQALADFVKAKAFQKPPYTTSAELIEYIRKATPAEFEYIIMDLFKTITLFDNRVTSATYQMQDRGDYTVRLRVASRKIRINEQGQEEEIPINDLIDIGILDATGRFLHLKKHKIEATESEIIVVVAAPPARAGIDPLNILIDRSPDDNSARVESN